MMSRFKRMSLSLCLCLTALASHVDAQQIAVAGSPINSIKDKNFARLFATLRQNGITTYFPTFQYQEVPEPKSLGFETDFVAPCSPNDPGFQALRASGMKLIIPGEFVYPNPARIGQGAREGDLLSQIIACAGRKHIAGITNYDEAAFHGTPIDAVRKFYNRVKEIDPTIPVLMVHGPIITDKRAFRNNRRINNYLNEVVAYSEYADIVGFDVYPVPAFLAKIATPLSQGVEVEAERAVKEYMEWLNREVPNKRKLMVLQGFAYTNLYEKTFREANVPKALLAMIRPPNRNQTMMMFDQARAANVELVIYWGPSSLPTTETAPWPTILELGRRHGK